MKRLAYALCLCAAALSAGSALAARPQKTFHLYVNDGEFELADGKKTYIVSYVAFNDKFEEAPAGAALPAPSIPAPTIRVKVGDDVRVILHNTGHHHLEANSAFSNVTHTIHFHGMDLVQVYDGTPGVPTKELPDRLLAGIPVGEQYEYRFVPQYEGTYMYHCHVVTEKFPGLPVMVITAHLDAVATLPKHHKLFTKPFNTLELRLSSEGNPTIEVDGKAVSLH